jgi:CRP-like cAMP-binding protein
MSQSHGRHIGQVNILLASVLAADDGGLASAMRLERPPQGQVLSSRTEPATEVWFPLSGVIALSITDQQGRMVQTGVVGREGCIGVETVYGHTQPLADATVQISGEMLVIQAAHLRSALEAQPAVQAALSQFLYELSAQTLQTVACNRLHSLEARCCRWLLMMQDRTGEDELPLTQEALATILGSGRPRINGLLAALELDGLVRRYRGRIRLLSRSRIERRACECYRLLNHAPKVPAGS